MKSFFSFWPVFFIWSVTVLLTLTSGFLFFNYRQNLMKKNQKEVFSFIPENFYYQMYVSQPKVLGETVMYIKGDDAIPTMIKNYLTRHKSPMLSSADALTTICRKYGIDPFLLVAIAQCESNLGKKMPPECHNPFGWGIHSAGTLCFETWEEGYEKVAKGLRERYLDKGLTNPYEIMTKYNLTSLENADGAWAKCVDGFLGKIQEQE